MSASLRAGVSNDGYIQVNGTDRISIGTTIVLSSTTTPPTTNTTDLGTASLRWRNIYTNDLQLSNGIGDYTIVEGKEDLFLYNNKTGKTFKFMLQEVDPSIVPAKAHQD